MRIWFACLTSSVLLASVVPAQRSGSGSDSIPVPHLVVQRDTLANGLTLLLSPDHSAPLVAVTIWYHVGSKNELPGHTGLAHLFEHMMFEGSQHAAKGVHFKVIEDAGGKGNATTAEDRTAYFESVTINQLETVLWLESDRMAFLLPGLTQAKLDNQRDVVKNERRQSMDDDAFGSAEEVMNAALFPASNPYSWPVLGSMTDLSAASLDDVRGFFRKYYAPNNAVLSIVGDIDTVATRVMVEKYFGSIPRGARIERPVVAPVTLPSEKRLVLEDAKSTQTRLQIAWPTVGRRSPDAVALDALGNVLTRDRTSRLTKVLVYDRQLATGVGAGQSTFEDAGFFQINVFPRPGVSLGVIEQVTDSVLATLETVPPTQADVDAPKRKMSVYKIFYLEDLQKRANTFAEGQTYFGDPLHTLAESRSMLAVKAEDVARVAARYLGPGRVVLSMVPAGKLDLASRPERPYTNVTHMTGATSDTAAPVKTAAAPVTGNEASGEGGSGALVDASRPRPVAGPPPAVRVPKIEMRRLANGVRVAVLENHALPIVGVDLMVDISSVLDDPPGKEGLLWLTDKMTSAGEGTSTLSVEQLIQATDALGNSIDPEFFKTTTANVDRSLALMAELFLHPTFPQGSVDRMKANAIAAFKKSEDELGYHADQIVHRLLYGAGHPYTRAATATSVARITRDDIVSCYRDYWRPRNATFVVVGDITPDSAVAKIGRAFATWAGGGKPGRVPVPVPHQTGGSTIYLYDKPGTPQSVIVAGELGPRRDTPSYYALQIANTILGGSSASRLSQDLREKRGYTYGVRSGFNWRRVPERSTFSVSTDVATAKTDSAVVYLVDDIRRFASTQPVVDSELAFAKRKATLGLPLQLASNVASAASEVLIYDLPLDYYDHLSSRFNALTVDGVREAVARTIDPSKLVIVIEGDRKVIEPGLRAAHVAPVVLVNERGEPTER